MKKFQKTKSFILGVIITALVGNVAINVAAALSSKKIDVYTGVKVYVDGVLFNPMDNNGNHVEVFTYNDLTYVPCEYLATALGKDLFWNQETLSLHFGSNSFTSQQQDTQASTKEITTGKIGAPGENLFPPLDDAYFRKNCFYFTESYLDRVSVTWIGNNYTGKEIKYFTVNFAMYNAVGDPAYCTIKRTNKASVTTVGPVPANSVLCVSDFSLGYTAVCSKVVLESLDLEYMDGTKEHIEYWYSTTDRRKS